MVHHILLLRFHAHLSAAGIEAVRQAILGLQGAIPGLLRTDFGPNIAPESRTGGHTHGFVMVFSSRADLEAYGPHPAHEEVARLVRSSCDSIMVLDLDTP